MCADRKISRCYVACGLLSTSRGTCIWAALLVVSTSVDLKAIQPAPINKQEELQPRGVEGSLNRHDRIVAHVEVIKMQGLQTGHLTQQIAREISEND